MADLVLRVNGRDLSSYVVVEHGKGLDPANPDYAEPQFSGAPALSEGMRFESDAVGNRVMVFPLILKAADTDAILQLVRDINRDDLFRGSQVEFAPRGASESTFFDLEAGRIEPEYQHWLVNAARLRCKLRLWASPRGNTASARTVAAFQGTGPQVFSVTGILGDTDALAKLEVRVGSAAASQGRVIAYGIHRSASYQPLHPGPSMIGAGAQASSVAVGASGAVGSMYAAIPVGPTVASGIAVRDYLTPPAAHVGRHRVFGILRSGLYPANALKLYATDRFGAPLGPTVVATQYDQTRMMIADFGEVQVSARASGMENVPTQYVDIIGGGASGASVIASPALQLAEVVYVPLDETPGMLRTAGVAGDAQIVADDFGFLGPYDIDGREPEPGDIWTRIYGYLGQTDYLVNAGYLSPIDNDKKAAAGATGFYAMGSGYHYADTAAEISLFTYGSQYASGCLVELWPKAQAASNAATVGVRVKLEIGPSANHHLALLSHDGTATTLHASVGLGASSASALYGSQRMRLVAKVSGNLADVYLATGALPATPLISATHANIAMSGHLALYARNGGINGWCPLNLDNMSWSDLGVSAPDTAPREWFRFESHPETRTVRANASVFQADVIDSFRGAPPKLPPVGSPGASGPAKMVVFQGEIDNFVGNDLLDVRLDAVEEFKFLR